MDELILVPTLIAVALAATGVLVDRNHSTVSKILVLLAVIFLGAYGTFIAPFVRAMINSSFLNSFGLIPICWIFGFIASPIAGASVAVVPAVILLRRGLGFIKTALIITSFSFILGLFLFKFGGCF